MTTPDRIEANRLAWEAAAPIHAHTQMDRLLRAFSDPEYLSLDATEQQILRGLDVPGKRVAQLCCNNGRELISIERMGAGSCKGFDISAAFLGQARELARVSGSKASFVCTDALSVPAGHERSFDLVYVSIGSITWMPDVSAFFEASARLLARSGCLMLYDMHPILWQYEESGGRQGSAQEKPHPESPDQNDQRSAFPIPELRHPYFDREAYRSDAGLDYFGGSTYDGPPSFCFQHTLGDIVSAVAVAGLVVENLTEYDQDISNMHGYMDDWPVRPPRSFCLVARLMDI